MSSSRLSERLGSQRRRGDGGKRWVRVVMAVLATIGVIDTGSITLSKWGLIGNLSCSSTGLFGCNGCEKVLSSAWSGAIGHGGAQEGRPRAGQSLTLLIRIPATIPPTSGVLRREFIAPE